MGGKVGVIGGTDTISLFEKKRHAIRGPVIACKFLERVESHRWTSRTSSPIKEN